MSNPRTLCAMPDSFFRILSPEEEKSFREHARKNYSPGTIINLLWHPCYRDECSKINEENHIQSFKVTDGTYNV